MYPPNQTQYPSMNQNTPYEGNKSQYPRANNDNQNSIPRQEDYSYPQESAGFNRMAQNSYFPQGVPQVPIPGANNMNPQGHLQEQKQTNSMPDILAYYVTNSQEYTDSVYYGTSGGPPPFTKTRFTPIDDGCTIPFIARKTLNTILRSDKLSNKKKLPIGLILTPFSEHGQNLPIVDSTGTKPNRCRRCGCFSNPAIRFIGSGRGFICNICGVTNDIDSGAFGNNNGDQRGPEFIYGAYDLIPPSDYVEKDPMPPTLLFVIDCTRNSVRTGALNSSLNAIAKIALDPNFQVLYKNVGIITFDNTVQIFRLNKKTLTPSSTVITDIDSPFIPGGDYFIDLCSTEHQNAFISLLSIIERDFQETVTVDSCLCSAITIAAEIENTYPGRIVAFVATPPTCGVGTTEKTKKHFYDVFPKEMASKGISVSMFSFYNDSSRLHETGNLAEQTGGQIKYYPKFNYRRDIESIGEDLSDMLTIPFVFDVVAKIRCSAGIDVDEVYGNVLRIGPDEFIIGTMDRNKTFAITFKQTTEILTDKVYFQLAVMHTTIYGERRVRIINTEANVTTKPVDVFQNADFEAISCLWAKRICLRTVTTDVKTQTALIQTNLVLALAAYRQMCSGKVAETQLVLPETLKMLPLMALAMVKSDVLNPIKGSDLRYYFTYLLKDLTVNKTIDFLYPPFIPLSYVTQSETTEILSLQLKLSMGSINDNDTYFLLLPSRLVILVGRNTPIQSLQDLFGIDSFDRLDEAITRLPKLNTIVSMRVHTLLSPFIQGKHVQIVRIGMDNASEQEIGASLIEDKTQGQPTYSDYIHMLHEKILANTPKNDSVGFMSLIN
eukprot:GHVP01047688.1.p1 GENE.GHVP01047688.1~~GHVP01047688.1.p1  ORF type:complete len:832 (-),score=113.11 GHVP01047688.1:506-3001(-)